MCGMHLTTVSPSSSRTRRSTPWVAGCCGPMLMSMCSPTKSGSIAGGGSSVLTAPPSRTVRGVRMGRPCASTPALPSATSTVRFSAMLLSDLFAGAEPLAHLFRQILERLRDRQLLHGVARFGIGGQRLTKLLGAAEPAAQREALAQRKAFAVLLPHQDPPQVRMADELDAEHVVALALEPVGALVELPHAPDLERRALVE